MEAILPDLNTGYIKYRNKIMESIDAGKFLNAIGSLYAENGMLPKEHQIIIDDELYNEKIKQITMIKCNHCTSEYPHLDKEGKTEERPTEHNFQQVRVYKLMLPLIGSLMTGQDYEDVWQCFKCKKINKMSQAKFIKTELKKPYYLQVVPNPPDRKDGLTDRQTYYKRIRKWAWQFLDELEFQMGEYRRNYQPKNNEYQDQDVNSHNSEFGDLEQWQ